MPKKHGILSGLFECALFGEATMQFDYFYGSQAEQFSFYRIPKVLFTDPQFKPLSTDANLILPLLTLGFSAFCQPPSLTLL